MKKNKKLRRYIIVFLMLFLGAYVLHILAFAKAPCKNETTLDELQSNRIKVEYVEDGWSDEKYESFCSDELMASEECRYIFKARPTGRLYFNQSLILQEVQVEEVLGESCDYETIWIDNGLAATLRYNKENIILSGMNRSFMQEDCEYLLFCEEVGTNSYSKRKVFREMEEGMWTGCYNITRDCETTVELEYPDYNPEIEYYSSNQRVLECYIEAKKALMERYLK